MTKKEEKHSIILGIDPGTSVMGYGVIRCTGKKMEYVDMGTINMSKLGDHMLKLKRIFEGTSELIEEHMPDYLAIEAPFFGKNVQSMLKLGRAQGIAMAAGLIREVPITEYAPKKIKQAITGNGNSSKEAVAHMLCQMLNIKDFSGPLDATDGLGAAVCHHLQMCSPLSSTSGGGGWKKFLKENPDRVG